MNSSGPSSVLWISGVNQGINGTVRRDGVQTEEHIPVLRVVL